MLDHAPKLDVNLARLDPDAWRARLDAIGEANGYFLPIGADHSVLFIDAGPRLLVTFEEAEAIRTSSDGRPRGFDLVTHEGWSLLTVIADGKTWFRSDALTWFFDRQVDDGFFEEFDRVLFCGTYMGAYGAAAYSVAAPGCDALLVRPVATLDPGVAGWDRRDLRARRLDFTSRYGFGPAMTEAARRVWTLHDPHHALDAMQAALFHRSHVTQLAARHVGDRLGAILDQTRLWPELLKAVMAGDLDAATWSGLWRARRNVLVYPRMLLHRAEQDGRRDQILRLCRHGVRGRDSALFEAKAEQWGLPIARLHA